MEAGTGRHEASFRRVSLFNQTTRRGSKQTQQTAAIGPKVVLSGRSFCTMSAIMSRLTLHRRGIVQLGLAGLAAAVLPKPAIGNITGRGRARSCILLYMDGG